MLKLLNFISRLNLNRTLLFAGIIALSSFVAFLFWWRWGESVIDIINQGEPDEGQVASLTGLACDNFARRPVAVMMASDPIARPLSGISQADVVIEMPVTPNGITRMMAVFQCEEPEEIGSVRSAREDFLPLADDLGAIYAHWGGEREALKKLDNGVLDNIDAMKYEGSVFYRKNSIPRPHNGFTNMDLLLDKAEDLGYGLDDSFAGFVRESNGQERNLNNISGEIMINYEKPYDVKWLYDSGSGSYKRARGGEEEMDANTGRQVEASVVILMHTASKILNRDYIKVDTTGTGEAEFHQNGIKTSGTWRNDGNGLKFYDTKLSPTETSAEMKFIPGKIWIEIIAQPSG